MRRLMMDASAKGWSVQQWRLWGICQADTPVEPVMLTPPPCRAPDEEEEEEDEAEAMSWSRSSGASGSGVARISTPVPLRPLAVSKRVLGLLRSGLTAEESVSSSS